LFLASRSELWYHRIRISRLIVLFHAQEIFTEYAVHLILVLASLGRFFKCLPVLLSMKWISFSGTH
jgi:hypothetical protein